MEPIEKTQKEYLRDVSTRFGQLSKEEAEGLLEIYGTPQLVTISKILGPEVSSLLGEVMNQIASAKNSPNPNAASASPETSLNLGMASGGLVRRPKKKPVAKK